MIIVDTGPIVAAQLVNENRHDECARIFRELRVEQREFLITATVLAEVGYLLRTVGTARDEVNFLRAVADEDFTVVDLEQSDLERIAELAEIYIDHPLGVTDASIMAVAERLGITEVVAMNPRDFRAVVPRHAAHFTLLP